MKTKGLILILICFLLLTITACASTQQSKLEKSREKDPTYQYNLGLFYLNGNNVDEAIKYLNKSISLNPRNHLAWNALGLAYSMKADFSNSIKAFQKALEINPQFTEAHNNLGTIYFELKEYDKAEAEYRRAISDPNYNSKELPYYNLARLYFIQERYEDAFENIQKSIQVRNRFALAHNLRGLILEKLGDNDEAENSFAQAVKIVPDDPTFLFNLARTQFNNGKYNLAKENFENLLPKLTSQEDRAEVRNYLDQIKKLIKD
ncbi:MAG: tetratricopeptide repeat protein [Candidatus Aminicenantes bacterium]|nr:tetratricopeptide repeat protein [Candidatus Aminicenantes bacterium]